MQHSFLIVCLLIMFLCNSILCFIGIQRLKKDKNKDNSLLLFAATTSLALVIYMIFWFVKFFYFTNID